MPYNPEAYDLPELATPEDVKVVADAVKAVETKQASSATDLADVLSKITALQNKTTLLEGRIAALEASKPPVEEPPTSTLPQVTPLSAGSLWRSYRVCSHPNFGATVYKNVDGVMARLADLNAYAIRGMYTGNNNAMTRATVAACRKYGIKWHMAIIPEGGDTVANIQAKVKDIAANAADVIISVEGENEPNHNRDGSPVASDWAAKCVAGSKAIADAIRAEPKLSHVTIFSPSLHDGVSTQQSYYAMRDAGITNYIDAAAVHIYPGGRPPEADGKIDERFGWVKNAYGANMKIFVSETGYTNTVNNTSQHKPVPEKISDIYGPRHLFQMRAKRGTSMARYEIMDDPDAAKTNVESNFGLVRVKSVDGPTSEWTNKPEFDTMKNLLGWLKDGDNYDPKPVGLKVTLPANSNVEYWTVQKTTGETKLFLYRNMSIFNRDTQQEIAVPAVDVVVETKSGKQTVKVDAKVTSVDVK